MKRYVRNGWFIFGLIFLIFISYFYILGFDVKEVINSEVGKKGTFGDSFGFLTALFSALAFGALVITLWQQQEELELTREELKKSANALLEQSKNLQQQNFENTFFNMLNLHNDIADEASKYLNIKHLYSYTQDSMGGLVRKKQNGVEKLSLDAYLKFYEFNATKIGHYFRNIYQILKFIKYSKVSNQKFYTNILRAQFSTTELNFLFFHCLSNYGKEKFKPLLEEYEFFEPLFLTEEYVLEDIEQYNIKVFGQNDASLEMIKTLGLE